MHNLMKNKTTLAIGMAILAAALYGLSSPVSKLLLKEIPPTMMAALLYLGAGIGMLILNLYKSSSNRKQVEAKITRNELPYVVAMVVLDIIAPISLMFGLTKTTAETASLLNNFEIVATGLIALFIFKEAIGKRMWTAITLITISSILLSVEDFSSLSFSVGAIFVVVACVCWGIENNCTRMLSIKDPLQIVVIKGFGAGFGSLMISIVLGEFTSNILYIVIALLLGFVAYGLGIFLYISAQRELGAARTSAYYAAAPFIGVLISWIVLHERITSSFIIALAIMLIGSYFAITEDHGHEHLHDATNHEHKHCHDDGHHTHVHETPIEGEHSHEHTHAPIAHKHKHTPDVHHRHSH